MPNRRPNTPQELQQANNRLERLVASRTRELEEANERLRDLDRLKDEFVSNVSHELRTPLTNIKLYLNLLQRGRAEKRDRYLSVLVRETERLNALVDDLLDLSRLDMVRARGAFVRTEVDMMDVVSTTVQGINACADEQGVAVVVRGQADPLMVRGDRMQLTQVVVNLLTNAVHYTPRGGRIDVSLVCDASAVSLIVSDTGIGIPASERSQAFDRFFRGAEAKELGAPGTGLGLAIVKEIVTLHGGDVAVDDSTEVGTRVVVRLPAADRQVSD